MSKSIQACTLLVGLVLAVPLAAAKPSFHDDDPTIPPDVECRDVLSDVYCRAVEAPPCREITGDVYCDAVWATCDPIFATEICDRLFGRPDWA